MSLQGIKNKFRLGASKAAIAAVASTSFFMASSHAESPQLGSPLTLAEYNTFCSTAMQAGYHCATKGYEKGMTADEITSSDVGKFKIVFHYGKGVEELFSRVVTNNRMNVPTIGIPGRTDDKVQIYLHGVPLGNAVGQEHVDNANVSLFSISQFNKWAKKYNITPTPIELVSTGTDKDDKPKTENDTYDAVLN